MPTLPGDRRQPQSDHRRLPRQPRHRHRQVRRLPHHQLGRTARRGRPLARRHRQPGAAAARRAARPQGGRRRAPFGYGRERYFWAFVVALVLFSMGGLFALYEGISKLRHPHEVESLLGRDRHPRVRHRARVASRCARRTARQPPQASRRVVVAWIRTAKEPELPVVLLEDTGAEIGLFFALGGVLLAHFTDEPRWDAVGSIAIGVAPRRHRDPARRRDEGPAHRRGGVDRADVERITTTLAGRAVRAPADPHQDPAPRPRRAARGGEAGVRPRPLGRPAGGGDQRGRDRACATPSRSPASCTSSRTSTARPSTSS